MKILYDHQAFTLQSYGGVTRSFYEIMKELDRAQLAEYELALRYSDNSYLKDHPRIRQGALLKHLHFPGKISCAYWWNQRESRRKLRDGVFDVFHPTYYDPYFLRFLGDKPFVLTIHDMIHELFPGHFPVNDATARHKSILAAKARRIIAVSENTKRDIVRFLDVDERKITVIYHGSSFSADSAAVSMASGIPDRFILFVGKRAGYKNFDGCIKALAPLLKKDRDLKFVCAGGGDLSQQERNRLVELGIEASVACFPGTHAVMAQLYMNALAFVFPSFYEGFGIPVLEAFSCGCPVVLSRSSSLPEVGGSAAVYFDPSDGASLAQAVQSVVYDVSARELMRDAGRNRLKNFSWKMTTDQTLAVYQAALSERER